MLTQTDCRSSFKGGRTLGQLKFEDFSQSATFQQSLRSKNRALWNAMLVNGKSYLVALAGWHCICHAEKRETIWASLAILATAEAPGSPVYAPVYTALQRGQWTESDRRLIGQFVAGAFVSKENAAVLVRLIPRVELRRWFSGCRLNEVSGTHGFAFIVGELHAVAGEDVASAPDAKLRTALAELAAIPGTGQYVFAVHGDATEPEFQATLVKVVNNRDLSELEIAVLFDRRRDYVLKNYDVIMGKLMPSRRKLLERFKLRRPSGDGR